MGIREQMVDMGISAVKAARALSKASGSAKQDALLHLADLLESESKAIGEANQLDLDAANERGLDKARVQRLTISEKVLASMIQGCRDVAAMPDPIGEIESMSKRPNGMLVGRMRVPLGVVAMIYESRPNATVDAGILCLKAGNSVILRGGSEAFHSNRCLADLMHQALEMAGLPREAVQVPPTADREAVAEMLKLDKYIDVVIPRGGEGLIRAVTEQATMPVLKHYKGVCHIFADDSCDVPKAVSIIENAKTQYPSGCNALECLLVHKDIAATLLPEVAARLGSGGVRFKACERALPLLGDTAESAEASDWGFEFLDLVMAVKVVDSLDEAIDFIADHGSNHTESILSEKYEHCMRFIREVDASLVVANATTRFNDGAQLGLGAEIGISTSKLHAYGPMGIKELTSAKFVLLGEGHIRE
ncbi:glutamate-5-semialdehyde dehydrogenase [Pseudodesulfovibrio piezophilus]|uniref:Gamma-glutamyl phosphate reductase n=1 Tax=Pseudodesulfovibrio piezophilus (strain DSM 21447 / JCM 15486 / C1TLV30) TaxID=1322246 RepID=M1WLP3_PSEP2|nr:glutamate-5-semialdehyde dehydrogenase [Pseudodesulfovibrio piezophilus]CCH48210.1 Gamma-glutamyl phosphate reductase [Pseudodesulfovibrio piezophilus C1TLV30]